MLSLITRITNPFICTYMNIQNAVRVIETGEIIASKHTHDYQSVTTPSGKTAMVDGGPDYFRRGGDAEVEELYLDDKSTVWDQLHKQIWGTRGPNGDQPLKYILLKDAEIDHLQGILENVKISDRLKMVIRLLITLKTDNDFAI